MRNKKRRSAQRRVNKEFRKWNRILLNDELWRGRFQVSQSSTYWMNWGEGNGDGFLYIYGVVYDKKTGNYMKFFTDEYFLSTGIGVPVNEFIAHKSGVWDNIEEVKNDKTNWSKVIWHP